VASSEFVHICVVGIQEVSAPNIIATDLHASLKYSAVRAIRKLLKLSFDHGDSCSKKFKRSYGGAFGGVWRSQCFVGVWSLQSGGLCYVISAFGRNLAQSP
jgi:hypothetical protein